MHSQHAHLLLFFDPRSGDDDEERDLFLLSFFRSGERDRDLKKGDVSVLRSNMHHEPEVTISMVQIRYHEKS